MTPIIWGRMEGGHLGLTTGLHFDRETEFIALARSAYNRRSDPLPESGIETRYCDKRARFLIGARQATTRGR